jgi:hypothetical protein
MVLKAYDASKHQLSSGDIGSFVLAIIELRCLDVGQGLSSFSRVSHSHIYMCISRTKKISFKTYWAEALKLRTLASYDHAEEDSIKSFIDIF